MEYRQSIGNDMPELVDCTSSPTSVYLRKNIKAVEETDQTSGETKTVYTYDEACVTKDEYIAMLHEEQEITNDALQELIIGLEV